MSSKKGRAGFHLFIAAHGVVSVLVSLRVGVTALQTGAAKEGKMKLVKGKPACAWAGDWNHGSSEQANTSATALWRQKLLDREGDCPEDSPYLIHHSCLLHHGVKLVQILIHANKKTPKMNSRTYTLFPSPLCTLRVFQIQNQCCVLQGC